MGEWRLVDKQGKTIKVIEAADSVDATLFALRNYPAKFSRAVDLEAEKARQDAALVRLEESFKQGFIKEGMTEDQADKLAEIAIKGKAGTSWWKS